MSVAFRRARRQSGIELIIELAPYVTHRLHTARTARSRRGITTRALFGEAEVRAAVKRFTGCTPEKRAIDGSRSLRSWKRFLLEPLTESSFANHVDRWLQRRRRCRASRPRPRSTPPGTLTPEGKVKHRAGVLFKRRQARYAPSRADRCCARARPRAAAVFEPALAPSRRLPADRRRHGPRRRLDQAHYCIKCHNQGKDSCSTGLKEKDAPSVPACSA